MWVGGHYLQKSVNVLLPNLKWTKPEIKAGFLPTDPAITGLSSSSDGSWEPEKENQHNQKYEHDNCSM